MKWLLLVAAILCSVHCYVVEDEWQQFKAKFNKSYSSAEEEARRRAIFLDNKDAIQRHNQLYAQGRSTFTMGVNQFADMTGEEFAKSLKPIPIRKPKESSKKLTNVQAVPDSIDWRDYGLVTPVKDQGQCGSSESFGITGAIEGQHAAATGKLMSLSETNLQQCTPPYGGGCSGGLLDDTEYQYVIDYNGQDSEGCFSVYTPEHCYSDTSCKAATISSYNDVTPATEDTLKEACGTYGPIAAAVDASHASFQLYSSGIYDEPLCSSTQLDQSILVVGYGSSQGNDYWTCKNSWGATWGQQGYIQMSRNKDNQCGIASWATWPTV